MIEREATADTIRLSGPSCTFVYERLRPGLLLVRIAGYDDGSLGTAPLDEIAAEIDRAAPLTLFVDASGAEGATWEVSQQWTHWFRAHQARLAGINILAGSKYVQQTILVSKELSRTGNLIRSYTDPAPFAEALDKHRTG